MKWVPPSGLRARARLRRECPSYFAEATKDMMANEGAEGQVE
jgi:hypothetical protein